MSANKFHFLAITFLSLLLVQLPLWAASVNARIDNTRVLAGESFQVTFTIDDHANNASPDFTPLEKDFIILGTNESVQMQFINGNASSSKRWVVVLVPRQAGEYEIPPVHIGNAESQAIKIRVLDQQEQSAQGPHIQQAFIEAEVNQQHPYVQSEVIYTLRLYSANRLVRGSIVEPQSDQALVMQLGDDTQYQEEINGTTYRVVERRYGIFPQESGALELSAPVFSGTSQDNVNRLDQWFSNAGTAIRLTGPAITLDVKPVPAAASGQEWLPARSLTLSDSWPKATVRVGEPITRTVIMAAQGLTAAQLPDVSVTEINGLNTYPDQAKMQNKLGNDSLFAERIEKIAYIPTQTGEVTLPAITIPWWNIQTDSAEVAELPAVKLRVLAAKGSEEEESPAAVGQTGAGEPAVDESAAGAGMLAQAKESWYVWVLALMFFSAWITTLSVHRVRQYRQGKNTASKVGVNKQSLRAARAALKQACFNNDTHAAKAKLLVWAALRWPEQAPENLTALVDLLSDPDLTQALNKLTQILYSAQQEPWDGHLFWQVLVKAEKAKLKSSCKRQDILPPLYLHK